MFGFQLLLFWSKESRKKKKQLKISRPSQNLRNIQIFLGFTKYYRRFIKKIWSIATLLILILQKKFKTLDVDLLTIKVNKRFYDQKITSDARDVNGISSCNFNVKSKNLSNLLKATKL